MHRGGGAMQASHETVTIQISFALFPTLFLEDLTQDTNDDDDDDVNNYNFLMPKIQKPGSKWGAIEKARQYSFPLGQASLLKSTFHVFASGKVLTQ